MRRNLPSRRMKWWLAAVLLLTAIACWLGRGPREPVFKGKKLSWWFTDGYEKEGRPRLTGDELRRLGPDAVRWLSYKVGQSSIVDMEMPTEHVTTARRFLWSLHERWFHEGTTKFSHVRGEAIGALGDLGPDAAPAIPSLLKALRFGEPDARAIAAEALLKTGKAGWPAIEDAMRHGDLRSRWLLLNAVDLHWKSYQTPPGRIPAFHPPDFVETVTLLGTLTSDPEERIRRLAGVRLDELFTWWSNQPDYEEGIHRLVDGLVQMSPSQQRAATDLLASHDLWVPAVSVVPQLIRLARTDDVLTRIHLLGALAVYDSANPQWVEELHNLAKSSDVKVTEAAEDVLGLSWRPGRKRNGE